MGRSLGKLEASLLGNLLTGNRVKQSNILGWRVMQAGERTIRAIRTISEGTIRTAQDF